MPPICRVALFCVASLASLVLSACSSQQLYGAAQARQRNECNKISDSIERERCMEKANTSYDQYRRESETQR